MITLELDADGYELDTDLRRLIGDRIGSLDEYMDELDRGHVTVSSEGGTKQLAGVRAQVWGPRHHFEASSTDRDPGAAVDEVRRKLQTQIRRDRGKEVGREHGS